MRPEHWAEVAALAAAQHGLVSTEQVLGSGACDRSLRRALTGGRLTPVRKGVLAVAGAPASVWQPLQAAILAAGPGVVASHESAAGLHRLPGFLPGAVEVTGPAGQPLRLQGVACHSTGDLRPGDVVEVDGFPVTSPTRTILDLSGRLSPYLLGRIVDDACRRHVSSTAELQRCLDELGGRGRRGTVRLRRVLDDRLGGDSDLEARWLRALRRAGLSPPALQHQVVVGDRVFLLDLAWPRWRVGVEVDGWRHHGNRSAWDHDHDKANAYLEAGWWVLFVTSNTPVADTARQLRRFMLRNTARGWHATAK